MLKNKNELNVKIKELMELFYITIE